MTAVPVDADSIVTGTVRDQRHRRNAGAIARREQRLRLRNRRRDHRGGEDRSRGELTSDADELNDTGYRVPLACASGVRFDRWVTPRGSHPQPKK